MKFKILLIVIIAITSCSTGKEMNIHKNLESAIQRVEKKHGDLIIPPDINFIPKVDAVSKQKLKSDFIDQQF